MDRVKSATHKIESLQPDTSNVRLFRIFAEVFSKDCRYLVRKPIGRDHQHRGHRTGDVELVYTSEIVSGKRILKWREGTEERSINIEAILLE